ncbi:2Fe-2S iron-sulfur cluster binding domain-containing protein [Zavarzinia aquatilis]|uniref:Ferredoxin n=1 Tax=Zavarzinia aquatilis TaxID=2211142 RepID=A0A317DX44_9PROT|nr:2Fe-2S iron-sulfur cluster binding domain-containing protein [Zavarzinia aquatilis]PWR17513.1 ferredoxin [Zavarzinia aquatilis]
MTVRHTIRVENCGDHFTCPEGEGVLQAMEKQGRSSIPVGCRSGGCGRCRVEVTDGAFKAGPMSRRHVSEAEGGQALVLACRIYPRSDLTIRLATPAFRTAVEK